MDNQECGIKQVESEEMLLELKKFLENYREILVSRYPEYESEKILEVDEKIRECELLIQQSNAIKEKLSEADKKMTRARRITLINFVKLILEAIGF